MAKHRADVKRSGPVDAKSPHPRRVGAFGGNNSYKEMISRKVMFQVELPAMFVLSLRMTPFFYFFHSILSQCNTYDECNYPTNDCQKITEYV